MARGKRTRFILYLIIFRAILNETVCQNPVENALSPGRPAECAKPTCACCLSKACDTCNYQCLDGYFGKKCMNICPDRCVSCNHTYPDNGFPNCTECKPGYYSTTDYYQCNNECPCHCTSCVSQTQCQSCKKGYYLELSSSDSQFGSCFACPRSCEACVSYKNCSECKAGLAGDSCQDCLAGLYGENCNTTCSENCKNKICSRFSGDCLDCYKGYDGSKCDQCMRGRHGDRCNKNCPENCKESVCGRNDGRCTSGCLENFEGDTCENRKSWSYGPNCSEVCPDGCRKYLCDNANGVQVSNPVPVEAIVGGGTAFVVVISLSVVLVAWLMKRRREAERPGLKNMSYSVSEGTLNQTRPRAGDECDLLDQVKELRLENQRLREENDFLRSDNRFEDNDPLYINQLE